MSALKKSCIIAAMITAILSTGCTNRYAITHDLEDWISPDRTCKIGAFADELPINTAEGDKPTIEDVAKFKECLTEEIEKYDIINLLSEDTLIPDYEIRGSFLEYKKGSGVVRFFVGFGLGNADCVMTMRLVDNSTGLTVFGGNFRATVSSGLESGDNAYRQISRDFCKQLEKRLKKLRKEQEKAQG
ncbi:MAG: DUF4410 domain-containing protein [Candidatus Zixiibacteriota bacterium]